MAAVFILGPGRSFTSIIGGMLGQHPELFGLPELNLNVGDTVAHWLALTRGGGPLLGSGLLRTVAQLQSGVQTAEAVEAARAWLISNARLTSDALFHHIEEATAPHAPVEKSPLSTTNEAFLVRLARFAPDARYIHLTRHPYTTCTSIARNYWFRPGECWDQRIDPPIFDPQLHWYGAHARVMAFLETVPAARWVRLRGEDILEAPETSMEWICDWLGIDTRPDAIRATMHPEKSPFACVGPPNAPAGQDPSFLESPALRPFRPVPAPLSGPLPWRPDGLGFEEAVVRMAKAFGYTDDPPPSERGRA